MEVGGYNVRYKVTRGWFQSEGVGEGHWYHAVQCGIMGLSYKPGICFLGGGGRSATRVASV